MGGLTKIGIFASALMLLAPATATAPVEAVATVQTDYAFIAETAGTEAVLYTHNDCVGVGTPTAPPHTPNPHTTTVTGFVFNGVLVRFSPVSLTLFGSGICPTTVSGPFLPQDFTGTYRMTAVCGAGTQNPGTVWLDFEIRYLAGIPIGAAQAGLPCTGFFNQQFSADITIAISPVTFIVTLPPVGGIQLTISQP